MVARSALTACLLVAIAGVAAGCISADDATPSDGEETGGGGTPPTNDAAAPTCVPASPPVGVDPVGPEQGGVTNEPGAFTYGGQSAGKTGTESYVWENPSGAAQITWGGQALAGTLKLTAYDACGVKVYEKEQAGPQQGGAVEATEIGTAGDWLLTFEFAAYTAQMGLTISAA